MDGPTVVAAYRNLYQVERSFRMTKSDLAARPVFHRLQDSIQAHLTIVFVTCDAEVYALRPLRDSLNSVEKTLRLADPAFMYNAFILEYEIKLVARPCPPDLVKSGNGKVKAVLVGAYDGEGFVFARAVDLDPGHAVSSARSAGRGPAGDSLVNRPGRAGSEERQATR